MKFSILTPHHNQLPYLRCCTTSIREQLQGSPSKVFDLDHHIQDSGATGLHESELRKVLWRDSAEVHKSNRYQLDVSVEPDEGMYDALNKAYARSTGDIIGHLNCDEQYLPGTLEYVQEQFNRDPDLQVLTGAVVVTYPDGSYSCSRLPAPPGRWHTQVCHLSLFTAATFYRRSLIEDLGMFFDTRYRAAGDADLFIRIIQSSVKIKLCHQYFALFTETGENLALSNTALEEQNYLKQKAPRIIVKFSNLIAGTHKFKKLLYKCYFPQKFTYSFLNKDLIREKVYVGNPRGVWKDRRNKNL